MLKKSCVLLFRDHGRTVSCYRNINDIPISCRSILCRYYHDQHQSQQRNHHQKEIQKKKRRRSKQWQDPQVIHDRSLRNVSILEDTVRRHGRHRVTAKMYTKAIKGCIDLGEWTKGRWIESTLILKDDRGCILWDEVLWTCLLTMHFHFGDVERAMAIWNVMMRDWHSVSVSAWNGTMSGLLRNELYSECLFLWNEMIRRGVNRNAASFGVAIKCLIALGLNECAITVFDEWSDGQNINGNEEEAECKVFILALKATANLKDLDRGQRVHRMWMHRESEYDDDGDWDRNRVQSQWRVSVRNAVISMYGECGDVESAEREWNEMAENGSMDTVSLNAMMTALMVNGKEQKALNLFFIASSNGESKSKCNRNEVTFINALRACIGLKSMEKGLCVLTQFQSQFESESMFNLKIQRKMKWLEMELYGECGDVKGAESVFNEMSSSSDWNRIKNGDDDLESIDDYVLASNRMMNLYAERGDTDSALLLMSDLMERGIEDVVSYKIALKAATNGLRLESGRAIHDQIEVLRSNEIRCPSICDDDELQNHLLNLYGKCGDLRAAEVIWNGMAMEQKMKSIVPWNIMMAVYVDHNEMERVLALRRQIETLNIVHLQNERTMTMLIMAHLQRASALKLNLWNDSGSESDNVMIDGVDAMKQIEAEITCSANVAVFGGVHLQWMLLRAFWNYGDAERAIDIWNHGEDMKSHHNLYWNLFCAECIAKELPTHFIFDALHQMMARYAVTPDVQTLMLFAKFCGEKALSDRAMLIHSLCRRHLGIGKNVNVDGDGNDGDHNHDVNLYNVLITMHSKCGHLNEALSLWNHVMKHHPQIINASTWNSVINALTVHNQGKRAFNLFQAIKHWEGGRVRPDHITYCTVITATSHSLMFKETQQVVEEMNQYLKCNEDSKS